MTIWAEKSIIPVFCLDIPHYMRSHITLNKTTQFWLAASRLSWALQNEWRSRDRRADAGKGAWRSPARLSRLRRSSAAAPMRTCSKAKFWLVESSAMLKPFNLRYSTPHSLLTQSYLRSVRGQIIYVLSVNWNQKLFMVFIVTIHIFNHSGET